ncbi:IscS subfamily cysteine desulfurase [Bacillus sp. Marseille-Q3570]|uniref:IscS subfamily cysteine desulfurase n=1 Tax=Bacillus sp. Marseille-Q3570 TaxID=2963522 RepID=UPI0021B6E916|nr:IscS subfamily cysteine desulfurase [Bacillus sp. Marseille-Q3570]
MIYMDHAATTPMSEAALRVYCDVSTRFYGNSSSLHDVGSDAQFLLEECRNQLANYFNGSPEGIYFTSGGSESNHLAIVSMARANATKGNHLITTETEHASVANTFALLENEGFRITKIPVDPTGLVDVAEIREALTENTILASIGHANSEIGTIQPLKEIGQLLKSNGVLFHSDCVQTFGKVPFDIKTIGLDSLSVSSHKVYGPKGVGACYIAPGVLWRPSIPGSTHEKGFRAGTVNVPGNAAFVAALEEIISEMSGYEGHYRMLREKFVDFAKSDDRITIEGHPNTHLPSIIGFRIKGIEGQYLMLELNRKGFAVSTGSACSVGKQSPSKTMLAIGRNPDEARELVRVSFGKETTEQDVEALVAALEGIVTSMKTV